MLMTSRIAGAMAEATTRHNEKLSEQNDLFDAAIEAFELRSQWPSGHCERLLTGYLRGKYSVVSLKNVDGWIKLVLIVNGRTQYQASFTVGYHDPERGRWTLSKDATLSNFNLWHIRTRRDLEKLENKKRI